MMNKKFNLVAKALLGIALATGTALPLKAAQIEQPYGEQLIAAAPKAAKKAYGSESKPKDSSRNNIEFLAAIAIVGFGVLAPELMRNDSDD